MAARAWATAVPSEEVLFQNESVSLCLLLNRKNRTIRIFDFRTGASPTKTTITMSLARREQVERIFTIVEREEVGTWHRLGLKREGVIPGFYRRSDAHLLGIAIDPHASPPRSRSRHRPDRRERAVVPFAAADTATADATLHAARKLELKQLPTTRAPVFRLLEVEEPEIKQAALPVLLAGTALTSLEPFGRSSVRKHFFAQWRGVTQLMACAEIQPCFGHACLEFVSPPRDLAHAAYYASVLGAMMPMLAHNDVVSCFAFTPTSDATLAAAFLAGGFRRTGVLARHLQLRDGRVDAFLWTRKTGAHP